MKRLKCIVAYDGTHFSGYQVQPNKRTVQLEIEAVLEKMHNKKVPIYASGRTDTNVHAQGQVIHFDTNLNIPCDKWKKALNSMLPDDIVMKNVCEVDAHFHARYDVTSKEYRYHILRGEDRNPFTRSYAYHYPYPLDYSKMKKAITYLLGTHDFTSFCSARTEVEDKIRTIYKIYMYEENSQLVFRFVGSGFLYNMVRILVGTLLEVGQGRIEPDAIKDILESKSRPRAGKTAPSQGLYLWRVFYDN
ncbi:tRNA pseudouridine(38-40) synthase TruA [Priestia megaterium]|jgi:tRNA pseudouridine38-40 synthase|uniref:tRNA pseudouridine(38-40) synthase TruA n=1 Tax=Priestia megaterium TaxID=1404 RepID=UPI0022829ED4|nr:tRNA pseudouridine(38-40) synthase TruA [Priestia megaterium]MCY9020485.1 tRNA pseudouridine(38-40) synthase TruA [Priestia megaterium]MCY9021930.1 tRNA pseudouridine(38-40) synthase TruA [Priestia megaterium]